MKSMESQIVSQTLTKVREAILKHDLRIYSVTEIRNKVSETIHIVPASHCNNIYSVAKSFMVAAIGMLEKHGLLSTEDFVYPIMAQYFPEDFDQNWKKVKIADLLSHRWGIDQGFLDIDCEYAPDWGTDDYLSLILARKLPYEPGTAYQYSDAAYYLISRIFTRVCGEKADDFLARELLTPLRFREFAFSKCPHGFPMGGTGLYICTADMAKLGQLFLQYGVYENKRYLSEEFVKKALGNFDMTPVYGGYAKGGMLGQYLYFNYEKEQVIAFQGHNTSIKAVQIIMNTVESVL